LTVQIYRQQRANHQGGKKEQKNDQGFGVAQMFSSVVHMVLLSRQKPDNLNFLAVLQVQSHDALHY